MNVQPEVRKLAFALEAAFDVSLNPAPQPQTEIALPPATLERQLVPLVLQLLESRGVPDSALHD